MSTLKMADLHSPPNNIRRDLIMRHTAQFGRSEQGTAATLLDDPVVGATPVEQPDKGGTLYAYLVSSTAATGNETLTIDVKKNGVSVLTSPYVYDSTKPAATQILLPVIPGTTTKTGDVHTVDRTLANGDTITSTCVRTEWSAGEQG